MELKVVSLDIPEACNIILGQTHFIKTAEDLCEILATRISHAQFGVAFTEASGPCLIRTEGNSQELIDACVKNLQAMSAGHVFCILLRNAFPIAVLNDIKTCQEVCRIFCATANPLQVVIAQSEQGSGVLGVIDGSAPRGVESEQDRQNRRGFLRTIGYKK